MSDVFLYEPRLKKVASLVKVANEICGRKKFQKLVHILKCLGVDFQERFKLHYFGPYSVDLQLEIEELVLFNILSESGYDPYIYRTNIDFDVDPEILKKRELIERLNKCDVRMLELLSTYFYLLNQGYEFGYAEKKLKTIKSHLYYLWPETQKFAREIGILK